MVLQFKNLKQVITTFSDEKVCRNFLVQQRWSGSPICPYCGSNKWYSIEDGKRFKCGNKECYKKYSVTVGTFMHDSNLPLSTWLPAMYLITSRKKGISSCQIAKDLSIPLKTAWFILQRLRGKLKRNDSTLLKHTVEIDEFYAGPKQKNMSNKRRAEIKENGSSNFINKVMVVGLVERGGDLRLEIAGNETNKSAIAGIVSNNVDKTSTLMTDGEGSYVSIGKNYAAHHSVNHAINEYVRDGIKHTNTIEGAFGLFRRTVIGTYHKISPKHLSRYCDEMEFRYNTRKMKDGERFEYALGNLEGTLSWKELIKENGLTAQTVIEPEIPAFTFDKPLQGKKHEIIQLLDGKEVNRFPSIIVAANVTGIKPQAISGVLRNKRRSTGGFQWKYA